MASFSINAAAPGLGKLASALAGDGYEKARASEILLQSKLAQALAEQQMHDAAAQEHTSKAALNQSELAGRAPEVLRGNAMMANGIPLDESGAVDSYLNTGSLGGKYAPAADGYGPELPQPAWAGNLGKVASAIASIQNAVAIGDKNSENIARGRAIDRSSALSDAIINGTADRNTVGGAQAAAAGKGLFHAGSDGAVLDQFGGQLDTRNPLAQSTIALRGAQAGSQNASAAAANALADQRKAVTAAGPGNGKAPSGYQWSEGPDGEMRLAPIPGGPKDPTNNPGKPLPSSAAKGYLENIQNLERAQKALDLVSGLNVGAASGDTQATGWKGYVPNTILNRTDPEGVDTRAALSDIGSLVIHDRSGAAVSASEFPRLQPFIPSVRDDPATVKKKLKLFAENYKAIVDDQAEFYRGSGYQVPTLTKRNVAAATKQPGAAPAGGFTYLGKE